MIQSQFDAATRLDVSKSQMSGGESDGRECDERPRKRRKTTPPIEDTIEVAVASSNGSGVSPDETSMKKAMGSENGCLMTAAANEIGAHCRNDGLPSPKVPAEAEAGLEAEAKYGSEESKGETLGQMEENSSSLARGMVLVDSSRGSIRQRGGGPSAQMEAPDPLALLQENKDLEDDSYQIGHVIPKSASSKKSSRYSSPALGAPDGDSTPKASRFPPDQAPAPSTGPSTPKHSSNSGSQTKFSSPLSSPPTELSNPFDEQLIQPPLSSSRPSSPISDDEGDDEEEEEEEDHNDRDREDEESEPSSSQERFNQSSTFRRSLTTLKGRELFDASIWADPLKTSVFYTFATNLRQKSRDASPTGCHHFISHLSKAGKMVRCYTQNIDLLEDKVGLSTRLLLGPGNRSRFSTRTSKSIAGSATLRNSGDLSTQPALVTSVPVSDATVSEGNCQHAVADRALSGAGCPTNSQGATSSLVEEINIDHRRPSGGDQGLAKGPSDQGLKCDGELGGEPEQDSTTGDAQPVDASSSTPDKPLPRTDSGSSTPERDRGVECVFLHGSLRALRCFQCGCVADWDEGDRELQTMSGRQPPCPRCEDATVARQERGKRALGVGKLRPDIVLYGEDHPDSQRISTIIQHDISLAPDMLIIMGTSLKVHGLKTVVREFSKAVHNRKDGKVIFVNYTKPAESVWADVIDFWVEMDCDAWIEDLKNKKPIIWMPPGSIEEDARSTKRRRAAKDELEKKEPKKSKKVEDTRDTKTIIPIPTKQKSKKRKSIEKEELAETNKPVPKRPAAFRDCKQNAVYWTTKIWADLASITGREVAPTAPPALSKAVPSARKVALTSANPPETQTATASALPVSVRRGPRTKNTKSRKSILEAGAASKSTEVQTNTPAKIAKSAKTPVSQPEQSLLKEQPKYQQSSTLPEPSSNSIVWSTPEGAEDFTLDAVRIKREAADPVAAPCGSTCADAPVANSDSKQHDQDNSILTAVKSNHRIRKPKAIFGEPVLSSDPSSQRATPAQVMNPKSKASAVSQARKGKVSVKTKGPEQAQQAQQAQEAQAAAGALDNQMHILPVPPPRPVPMVMNTSQPHQMPAESFTLPPIRPAIPALQTANLNQRDSFLQTALGPSPPVAPSATSPPAYLEPTVSPGPKDMSPMMSPNHWRDCAFTYKDALSRHFEPPQRPLDYTGPSRNASPDSGGEVYRNAPLPLPPRLGPGAQPVLVDAPQLYADQTFVPRLSPADGIVPVANDSPSRQLQRESDAAKALSQMSQTVVYDNRQFVRI